MCISCGFPVVKVWKKVLTKKNMQPETKAIVSNYLRQLAQMFITAMLAAFIAFLQSWLTQLSTQPIPMAEPNMAAAFGVIFSVARAIKVRV